MARKKDIEETYHLTIPKEYEGLLKELAKRSDDSIRSVVVKLIKARGYSVGVPLKYFPSPPTVRAVLIDIDPQLIPEVGEKGEEFDVLGGK